MISETTTMTPIDSARTHEEKPAVKSEDLGVKEEGKDDNGDDEDCNKDDDYYEEEEEEDEKKLIKEEDHDDEDPSNEDSASPNTKKRIKKEETDDPEDSSPSPGTTNKPRKRAAPVKTKTSVKAEAPGDDSTSTTSGKEPPKKKRKGPRVKPEIIQHVAKQMLAKLIQNYKDDIQEVPMDVLTQSIFKKNGQPYKNHRSDAIAEALKLLASENKAQKVKYENIGAAKLLPKEIAKIPKEVISKDPQKVLEQRRQQFLNRLADHKKGGKGNTVVTAANAVFDKLSDGCAYSRKELVKVTSYKATNSSGFEGIMMVLKALKYIDNSGGNKCAFTDKVFPHGRPP